MRYLLHSQPCYMKRGLTPTRSCGKGAGRCWREVAEGEGVGVPCPVSCPITNTVTCRFAMRAAHPPPPTRPRYRDLGSWVGRSVGGGGAWAAFSPVIFLALRARFLPARAIFFRCRSSASYCFPHSFRCRSMCSFCGIPQRSDAGGGEGRGTRGEGAGAGGGGVRSEEKKLTVWS